MHHIPLAAPNGYGSGKRVADYVGVSDSFLGYTGVIESKNSHGDAGCFNIFFPGIVPIGTGYKPVRTGRNAFWGDVVPGKSRQAATFFGFR